MFLITFINITSIKLMKRHMKLMRIYDIQKNYQLHKQRLSNIKSTDTTNKIIDDVWTNIQKVNHFKQHKIISELFTQKEKLCRINTENNSLRDRMQQVSQRPHLLLTQQKQRKEQKSEFRLSRKKSFFENINQENIKIRERLSKTKSSYFRITKSQRRSHSKKINRQDEIIYLLEKQLKISPNVIFPAIKKHLKTQKHHTSIQANRKSIDSKEKSMEIKERSVQITQKSIEKKYKPKKSRMSSTVSKENFQRMLSPNGKLKEQKQQNLSTLSNQYI